MMMMTDDTCSEARAWEGIELRPWVGSSSMRAKALFTSPSLLRQSVSACNDLAGC